MSQPASSVRVDSRSRTAVTQHTRISPAAIQGLEVLSLPVTELTAYICSVVERNPLLDLDSDGFTVGFEDLPLDPREKDEWSASAWDARLPRRSVRQSDGFDLERLRDDCSQTETLACHLHMQLDGMAATEVDRVLVDAIIDCLDEDGYFDGSLPALCDEADLTLEEGERALRFVQTLLPRGVGARDLQECLLLQVDNGMPDAHIIRRIISDSLEDLAGNRTTKLMRTYRLSLDELARVRKAIVNLNPRPGAAFSQRKDTVYVIPDLIVERRGPSFSVRVTGEIAEKLIRRDEYEHLVAERGDDEARAWLAQKRAEADMALSNVTQRKRTLFRFGMYLVDVQYGFFCDGRAAMRPLTMQQAADELDVHVSTISRIVQDKHILTPWGVYPLKQFFSTGLPCTGGGGGLSSVVIKERIRALIDAEDARTPLSDAAVTEQLNQEGIDIKRRTVAKYREALGIPCQSQRRR